MIQLIHHFFELRSDQPNFVQLLEAAKVFESHWKATQNCPAGKEWLWMQGLDMDHNRQLLPFEGPNRLHWRHSELMMRQSIF
jgi:hypothetical protein